MYDLSIATLFNGCVEVMVTCMSLMAAIACTLMSLGLLSVGLKLVLLNENTDNCDRADPLMRLFCNLFAVVYATLSCIFFEIFCKVSLPSLGLCPQSDQSYEYDNNHWSRRNILSLQTRILASAQMSSSWPLKTTFHNNCTNYLVFRQRN